MCLRSDQAPRVHLDLLEVQLLPKDHPINVLNECLLRLQAHFCKSLHYTKVWRENH